MHDLTSELLVSSLKAYLNALQESGMDGFPLRMAGELRETAAPAARNQVASHPSAADQTRESPRENPEGSGGLSTLQAGQGSQKSGLWRWKSASASGFRGGGTGSGRGFKG